MYDGQNPASADSAIIQLHGGLQPYPEFLQDEFHIHPEIPSPLLLKNFSNRAAMRQRGKKIFDGKLASATVAGYCHELSCCLRIVREYVDGSCLPICTPTFSGPR